MLLFISHRLGLFVVLLPVASASDRCFADAEAFFRGGLFCCSIQQNPSYGALSFWENQHPNPIHAESFDSENVLLPSNQKKRFRIWMISFCKRVANFVQSSRKTAS